MKTKIFATLEDKQHYLQAVHHHAEFLLSQLAPMHERTNFPKWLGDPEGKAMGSPFEIHLQKVLRYLTGDEDIPAVELPDLLLAVHLVVDGVVGCEALARAILREHEDIASRPLMDALPSV